MLYRVFNNQEELDIANQNWITVRRNANIYDIHNGQSVTPSITCRWDNGRLMKDNRIACQVPTEWAEAFGGIEEEHTEEDFPIIESY